VWAGSPYLGDPSCSQVVPILPIASTSPSPSLRLTLTRHLSICIRPNYTSYGRDLPCGPSNPGEPGQSPTNAALLQAQGQETAIGARPCHHPNPCFPAAWWTATGGQGGWVSSPIAAMQHAGLALRVLRYIQVGRTLVPGRARAPPSCNITKTTLHRRSRHRAFATAPRDLQTSLDTDKQYSMLP
jgi:hypothetical protein